MAARGPARRRLAPYRDAALTVDSLQAGGELGDRPLTVTPLRVPAARGVRLATPGARSAPSSSSTSPGTTRAATPERVKVYVGYLRAKLVDAGLDPPPIETVRGFGYRYRPPVAAP